MSKYFRDAAQIKKLTPRHIMAEGIKQVGRSAFTTPTVSRRNSATDTDSRKSISPIARQLSKDERMRRKSSVASSGGYGVSFVHTARKTTLWRDLCIYFHQVNLLSVTSLETYLNSHSEDSEEDSCDILTINVPVQNVNLHKLICAHKMVLS